uniref:Putative secreted peptide n=1 Tax=Anopheles braziliensis TaxID=58242 RepID=A0A2M3ZRU7_9DIPT
MAVVAMGLICATSVPMVTNCGMACAQIPAMSGVPSTPTSRATLPTSVCVLRPASFCRTRPGWPASSVLRWQSTFPYPSIG